MVDPKASRFWQAVQQSGLVDDRGLAACWEAIPVEKRVPDQIDRRLARQAVQAGLLTLWQAQQLLGGKSTGFKIDRYILLEMIGQGGMGRVYLARDSRLNRRVALKILSPERVNNPRAIQRFQREAKVGAQLQHEHLVRIYDEGEANGKCYLVMEYIEGKNIGMLIAEIGPIPPATAAKLTRQVALGLEHAQQKGLIHRDVNPYNILVTRDGVAKLTDLGLAIDLADSAAVTRDGATVGTFDYVSPEQARHSHNVDTRSDIYSLGCTLYHMLSGRVPYPSPSLPEKLFGHQAVEPESLTTLVPGLPPGLDAIVRKMMRKSPDERYANPLELAEALEPYLDEQSPVYQNDPSLLGPHSPPPGSTDTGINQVIRVEPSPGVLEIPTPASVLPLSAAPLAPTMEMPSELALFAASDERERPREDLSALGLSLDFGPAPALSESPRARTKARPEPSPTIEIVTAPPLAPEPKAKPESMGVPELKSRSSSESKIRPAAPSPPPQSPPSAPPPPDFAALVGAEDSPREDLSGLGLGVNLGPEPALSEVSAKPRAKARAAPEPKAPAPAPPAPELKTKPAPEARPRPAPAPAPPPSQPPAAPLPDLHALAGDAAPQDDLSGLGLGLNFGPAPSPSESKPKTKARPAPSSSSPPAPAPSSPATPDFGALAGDAPPQEDLSGLGLGLDFGPEPPLSSGPASSKPKPRPAAPAPPPTPAATATTAPRAAATAPTLLSGPNRRWVLVGAGVCLLLAVVGVLATGVLGGSNKSAATVASSVKTKVAAPSKVPKPDETATVTTSPRPRPLVAKAGGVANPPPKAAPKGPEVPPGKALAVWSPDGTITIEHGLKSAMQRAIGSKGHVLLNNRTPVKFSGDEASILIGGGPLYLRAASGVQPVLEVELKGPKPFITTRTDTPITLVGITIIAHYAGQGPEKDAPPILEAGGNITLERCAFTVSGNAPVKGSRAVTAEGVSMSAVGCWFDGFDQALDIAVFAGSTTTVSQCMMVQTKSAESPQGWALRVRDVPGGNLKLGKRLVLEHCTARTKGFLELIDFSPEHQLKVDIKECAVQAEALIAWEGKKTAHPLSPESLAWSGTGNQYDIRGKAWVVTGHDAEAAPADAATDLASWSKLAPERDTVPPPIRFQTDPKALSEQPRPSDFGVTDQGFRFPGADPKQVGPSAPPTKAGFGKKR